MHYLPAAASACNNINSQRGLEQEAHLGPFYASLQAYPDYTEYQEPSMPFITQAPGPFPQFGQTVDPQPLGGAHTRSKAHMDSITPLSGSTKSAT